MLTNATVYVYPVHFQRRDAVGWLRLMLLGLMLNWALQDEIGVHGLKNRRKRVPQVGTACRRALFREGPSLEQGVV